MCSGRPQQQSRLPGWGLGCGLASWSRVCRSFPAPTRISAERRRKKKKKTFSLVTPPGIAVRNSLPASAQGRSQLRPGEPGTPARAPRRGRGGAVGRAPRAPRPRRRRRRPRRRPGARRAAAALGRPCSSPPPPEPSGRLLSR